jgi:uncharacterized membrane protein YqiK
MIHPHKFFQDGQGFLNSEGYRGPQLDTLQPGENYINPLLFNVQVVPVAEVAPGYVAVVRSNVGKELERSDVRPSRVSDQPDLTQEIHEPIEELLIADRDRRGIWRQPVAPGVYNLNPIAFTPFLVPTSAVTIDWAAGTQVRVERKTPAEKAPGIPGRETVEGAKAVEFFRFSQLRVTSKDGFQLDVDVRMVIRIRPEHAAFIIARFGSVANLIEQIVHPLIDSSFRNKAGEKKAIDFVQTRTELQKEALERAREEFRQYHVEAQNLLIAYIAIDQALLETQTKKEIAVQQQEQFMAEARAQEQFIVVQERKARVEKQPEVVAAKLSIDIARDRAESARREAEGVRDSTQIRAEGDATAVRKVGEAQADAYRKQAEVLGPQRIALLNVLEGVAAGKVKIVPDVQVTGGDGAQVGGNLLTAWLATMMTDGEKKSRLKQEEPRSEQSRPTPSNIQMKGSSGRDGPVYRDRVNTNAAFRPHDEGLGQGDGMVQVAGLPRRDDPSRSHCA